MLTAVAITAVIWLALIALVLAFGYRHAHNKRKDSNGHH